MRNDNDNKKPTDPSKYYLGLFYYNKEDSRLFPPKRLPFLGWTVNFANPYSILLMIIVIGAIVFITSRFYIVNCTFNRKPQFMKSNCSKCCWIGIF